MREALCVDTQPKKGSNQNGGIKGDLHTRVFEGAHSRLSSLVLVGFIIITITTFTLFHLRKSRRIQGGGLIARRWAVHWEALG